MKILGCLVFHFVLPPCTLFLFKYFVHGFPPIYWYVHRLMETGLKIRFITNTTKESKRTLVSRLAAMGFKISPRQVFTSLTAARALVEREGLTPYLMLEQSALEDFAGMECDSVKPNAVVVGLAPSMFDYEHLNKAFRRVLEIVISHYGILLYNII